eukprot:gb/GEZN01002144.1/.p1 GENE.gb/GEZN01002144.1/~~gb/GEZN01002144.1/.p1  ORF type:complete len:753 (-),score=113.60 gb/GEZN01002144.1/:193-2451(-)
MVDIRPSQLSIDIAFYVLVPLACILLFLALIQAAVLLRKIRNKTKPTRLNQMSLPLLLVCILVLIRSVDPVGYRGIYNEAAICFLAYSASNVFISFFMAYIAIHVELFAKIPIYSRRSKGGCKKPKHLSYARKNKVWAQGFSQRWIRVVLFALILMEAVVVAGAILVYMYGEGGRYAVRFVDLFMYSMQMLVEVVLFLQFFLAFRYLLLDLRAHQQDLREVAQSMGVKSDESSSWEETDPNSQQDDRLARVVTSMERYRRVMVVLWIVITLFLLFKMYSYATQEEELTDPVATAGVAPYMAFALTYLIMIISHFITWQPLKGGDEEPSSVSQSTSLRQSSSQISISLGQASVSTPAISPTSSRKPSLSRSTPVIMPERSTNSRRGSGALSYRQSLTVPVQPQKASKGTGNSPTEASSLTPSSSQSHSPASRVSRLRDREQLQRRSSLVDDGDETSELEPSVPITSSSSQFNSPASVHCLVPRSSDSSRWVSATSSDRYSPGTRDSLSTSGSGQSSSLPAVPYPPSIYRASSGSPYETPRQSGGSLPRGSQPRSSGGPEGEQTSSDLLSLPDGGEAKRGQDQIEQAVAKLADVNGTGAIVAENDNVESGDLSDALVAHIPENNAEQGVSSKQDDPQPIVPPQPLQAAQDLLDEPSAILSAVQDTDNCTDQPSQVRVVHGAGNRLDEWDVKEVKDTERAPPEEVMQDIQAPNEVVQDIERTAPDESSQATNSMPVPSVPPVVGNFDSSRESENI